MRHLPTRFRFRFHLRTRTQSIRYTLGRNDPTESSSLYTAPFILTATTTVKARGYVAGLSSDIVSAKISKAQVSAPVISPNGGTFNDSVTVTISDATAGSLIRYTVDGTEPTDSSVLYQAPIVLTETATVKAAGFLTGYLQSKSASATFTKNVIPQVAAPVISPAGGTFTGSVSVSISESTAGAVIHYTLDGSDPLESAPVYTCARRSDDTTTLKAKGFLTGYTESTVASGLFTVTAPAFDFSLSNGGDKTVNKKYGVNNSISTTLVSGMTQPVAFSVSGLPVGIEIVLHRRLVFSVMFDNAQNCASD